MNGEVTRLKKLLIILLIGVIAIFGISYHVLGFNFDRYEKEDQRNTLTYFHKYDDLIYTSEKDLGNENFLALVPMVHDFFDLLPDETAKRFNDEGWKIIISSEKPPYIQEIEKVVDYKVGGNTEHNLRIIYLFLNNNQPEYLLSDFVHEFGHYEDWEKGILSKSSSFKKIFNNNQGYNPEDTFSDEHYHLSSPSEFFACCYKDYFLYNDKLKTEAPEVYRYLGDAIWRGNNNFEAFYVRVWNYFG